MIDDFSELAKKVETKCELVLKRLTQHNNEKELPALFADITWSIHSLLISIRPAITNILTGFVEVENIDLDEKDKNI